MDEKYYLLFSDGKWCIASSFKEVDFTIRYHWWSFPLDVKGDPRRRVWIFPVDGISSLQVREKV